MRKTLVLVLALATVLSICCFGVSAAAGTPIRTAEEFAAMTADGTYYLDADIQIAASYTETFTGTLDGNGHTVIVSVPMFAKLSGTVKNLTVQGEVKVVGSNATAANYAGAVAKYVPEGGSVCLENIVSIANVSGESRTGGLIGQIAGNCASFTMTNCVNYGTVLGKGGNADMVGGLIGYFQGPACTITGCVNVGSVTAEGGLVGGIIGRICKDMTYAEASLNTVTNCLNVGKITGTSYAGGIVAYGKSCKLVVSNCTNKGEIISTGSAAGGIVGRGGAKNYVCKMYVTNCLNEGKVTTVSDAFDAATGLPSDGTTDCAGGLVGYNYGSGDNGNAHIENSVNKGEITCKAFVSQFLGYCNNKYDEIKNSYGGGKLNGGVKVIQGVSSLKPANLTGMADNKLGADDSTEYFTYATAESNAANRLTLANYLAQEATSSAFALNAAAPALTGIGSTVEQKPAPAPIVIEAPATGDFTMAAAVVAVIALGGIVVAVRKKED